MDGAEVLVGMYDVKKRHTDFRVYFSQNVYEGLPNICLKEYLLSLTCSSGKTNRSA